MLTYPDNSFDAAYSVSVLEHIPDNGDLTALSELVGVVKPGGIIVITVPYDRSYRETFVQHSIYERKQVGVEPVFFERHYDDSTLADRLLKRVPAELVDVEFWGEGAARSVEHAQLPIGAAPINTVSEKTRPADAAAPHGCLSDAPEAWAVDGSLARGGWHKWPRVTTNLRRLVKRIMRQVLKRAAELLLLRAGSSARSRSAPGTRWAGGGPDRAAAMGPSGWLGAVGRGLRVVAGGCRCRGSG